MKLVYSTLFAATLAFAATATQAGGPVVIEEDVEVVAEKTGSMGILPIIIVGIALCAALCGNDDDEEGEVPPSEP